MNIAVLGTGVTGQTIGTKLVRLGHEVMLGSRDPAKPCHADLRLHIQAGDRRLRDSGSKDEAALGRFRRAQPAGGLRGCRESPPRQ